jgi:SRF-type transcription factor (DNA-binding and dimerisation domain)
MEAKKTKGNKEGIRKKRKNEGINRRKDTLVKKARELGEFDGVDVGSIIRDKMYASCGNILHRLVE